MMQTVVLSIPPRITQNFAMQGLGLMRPLLFET
jgi:hypothetical protein